MAIRNIPTDPAGRYSLAARQVTMSSSRVFLLIVRRRIGMPLLHLNIRGRLIFGFGVLCALLAAVVAA
jgi:hypothetical protein